jgi:molybdate transport system substrate-binding protein
MRRARTLAAVAVLATALLAGCGGSGSTDGDEEPELVVFAAASLGPAFERYGEAFEGADVRYSFAGSDELAAQIRQGVEPDVYAAANTSLPEGLHAEGLLERPSTFATNELVVGVPAGSEIDDVGDLREPGVKVAIGDEDVPVGIYTREVLDALGAGAGEAILANVASSEPDVTGIVAKLTQGAVDAGFVYRSDVDAAAGAIEAVPLPERASPDVAYGIAVTTAAAEPEAAQRFVDGIIAGSGRNILADSGFGLPPR